MRDMKAPCLKYPEERLLCSGAIDDSHYWGITDLRESCNNNQICLCVVPITIYIGPVQHFFLHFLKKFHKLQFKNLCTSMLHLLLLMKERSQN